MDFAFLNEMYLKEDFYMTESTQKHLTVQFAIPATTPPSLQEIRNSVDRTLESSEFSAALKDLGQKYAAQQAARDPKLKEIDLTISPTISDGGGKGVGGGATLNVGLKWSV